MRSRPLPGLFGAAPFAAALLASLLGATGAAAAPDTVAAAPNAPDALATRGYAIEPFRWRAATTPQQRIVATNPYGDVRVRTTRRAGITVSAMLQHIGARELDVRVDERSGSVVVTVQTRTDAPRGRVDLTLLVPAGREVDITTRDGIAEIKYRGDVRVRSQSGAITVVAPGRIDARSVTGTVVSARP